MPLDQNSQKVGLAEAIAEIRAELSRARREGKDQDIRLSVDDIEVELALEFAWTGEAGGGVKLFSFVDVSAKAGTSEKSGHRLRLKLEIADPTDTKTKHREIASSSRREM